MKNNWDELKNLAEGLGSNLDPEAAWERFEKREERRKKPFWLFFAGIGSFTLLAIFVGGYFLMDSDNLTEISTENVEVSTSENIQNKANSKNATFQEKDQNVQTNASINEDRNTSKNQKLAKDNLDNTSSNTNIIEAKSNAGQSKKVQAKLESTTTTLFETNNNNDLIIYEANETYIGEKEDLNFIKSDEERNVIAKTKLDETQSILSIYSFLDHTADIISLNDKVLEPFINPQAKNPVALQDLKLWSICLTHTYSKVNRSMDQSTQYDIRRLANEDFLESNNTQFLVTRSLAKNLSISSGLSFGLTRSRLIEINQQILNDIQFEDVVLTNFTRAGETQEERGSTIGSQTILSRSTRYQKYLDVSIPLILSWQQNIGDIFSLELNAGVSYSLINQNKGRTYESENSFGSYIDLSELGYRKNGLIQGQLGIGLVKEINDHFNIRCGIQFRKDLNNRFNANAISSDLFSRKGIYLGISKNI